MPSEKEFTEYRRIFQLGKDAFSSDADMQSKCPFEGADAKVPWVNGWILAENVHKEETLLTLERRIRLLTADPELVDILLDILERLP